MRFTYPKDIRFACTKCGLCCQDTPHKTRHVLLLESDATRISRYTKQPVGTFAEKIPQKPPYVYEMHKDPQTGKCIFLQENQCSIYEHRPLICRFYPFELTTDEHGKFVFKETNECPSINSKETQNAKKLNAAYFRELLALACLEINRLQDRTLGE